MGLFVPTTPANKDLLSSPSDDKMSSEEDFIKSTLLKITLLFIEGQVATDLDHTALDQHWIKPHWIIQEDLNKVARDLH